MSAVNPTGNATDAGLITRAAAPMDGTRPAPKVVHLAHPALPAAREDSITEVVVVSFNAGRYLQTCVESVLQSSVPVRVLVVDNASTDGSLEQLGESHGCDSRLRILRNSDNLGFARANNRALATCNSRYVLVLNPDCFLGHDTLDRLRRVMDSDPSIGLAGCMVRNPDGTEQAGTRRSIPTPWRTMVRILHLDRLFPDRERFRNFVLTGQPLPKEPVYLEGVSGACMFVRREAMRQVGLMDEGYFLHCEDLDWFMRFRSAGWRIAFVPDVEVTHIKGGCSRRHPVRVLWHKHQGMVRFYKKFFRHQYPLPLMWGVIAAVWARFACLCLFSLILGRVGSPQAVD